MEAHGDFVRPVGLVFDPVANVIKELAEHRCDLPSVDADVPWRRAELPCPFPDAGEHPLMKLTEKVLRQDVATAPGEGPTVGVGDTNLLDLVQLSALRDVARDEGVTLLRR